MLVDFLEQHTFNFIAITETIEFLNLSAKPSGSIVAFATKLKDELNLISPRDSFELFFDANGNNIKLNSCDSAEVTRFLFDLEEYSEVSEYEIQLRITKNVVNATISVYATDQFFQYLNDEDLPDILLTLSRYFNNGCRFEIFRTFEEFRTRGMAFFSHATGTDFVCESPDRRRDILGLFCENSTSTHWQFQFLPDDFFPVIETTHTILTRFNNRTCAALCLAFIANSAKIEEKLFSYRIFGYKSVICDNTPIDELSIDVKVLWKIYSWAYSGGENSDKVGLIRNVLSIHLDPTGKIKFDAEAWEAIKSNYQIYLKRNLQSYLEVKNKLGEIIVDSTFKTYAMADQVLDAVKNNAFIILTFILTVVVVNGLKDSGETTVFSNAYLGIVVILTIVSGLWLCFTRFEVVRRFDSASATIAQVLKINYGKILMEAEIEESVTPVVALNRIYLAKQLNRYTWWWLLMLITFLLTFGVCNFIFAVKPKVVGTVKAVQPENNAVVENAAKKTESLTPSKQIEKPTLSKPSNTYSEKKELVPLVR